MLDGRSFVHRMGWPSFVVGGAAVALFGPTTAKDL